jgi:hypothetical protein
MQKPGGHEGASWPTDLSQRSQETTTTIHLRPQMAAIGLWIVMDFELPCIAHTNNRPGVVKAFHPEARADIGAKPLRRSIRILKGGSRVEQIKPM